jgi:NADH-quinone oxidoreductase subunit L
MTVPLVVLAAGAIFAGYLGVPEGLTGGRIPNYFEHFLEPSIAHPSGEIRVHGETPAPLSPAEKDLSNVGNEVVSEDHTLEWLLTGVSIIIALVGISAGWFWFQKKPLWEPPRLLEQKYYVDEAYDAAIVQPIKAGSNKVLWHGIDESVIDGAVNGAGYLESKLGSALGHLQSGLVRSYVAFVVLGALLIIGYFVMK